MSVEKCIQEAEFALSRGLLNVAETAFQEALHLSQKAGDDLLAAQAFRGLAVICSDKQNYQQVSKYAHEALSIDEIFWGPDSTQVADDGALAAEALMFLGNFEAAAKLYQQSLSIRRNYYNENHAQVVNLQAGLLLLYLQQATLSAAVEAHNTVLPVYKDIASGAKWTSFLKLDKLINYFLQQSQDTDAETVLRRELEILQQHFKTFREEIDDVSSAYNKLLAQEGRALAAWKINAQQHANAISPLKLLLEAKQHLVTGEIDKSDELFRQAIVKVEREHGSHSSQASDLRRAYENGAAQNHNLLEKVLFSIANFQKSRALRKELPIFLEALASIVESGVSAIPAVEIACDGCQMNCPLLSAEISKAIQDLKMHGTPLLSSLAQIGEKYGVDELVNLSSTLAMASKTGGSICFQIREQSYALRHYLKAIDLAKAALKTGSGVSAGSLLSMKAEEEKDRKRHQRNQTS